MRAFLQILATAVVLTTGTIGSAAIVTHQYDFEYSGGTPPAGTPPWLRATFDDGGGSGSVMMVLIALNLTGSEFVNDWYFNLDPTLSPASLNFQVQSTTGTFDVPQVLTGVNAFNAAGNTLFDIQVDFANAPPAARFGAGESITFLVTGTPTLNANSFSFFSVPGGQGPFISVAKVQAIGTEDGSGWVAFVPEPSALGLIVASTLLLSRRRP